MICKFYLSFSSVTQLQFPWIPVPVKLSLKRVETRDLPQAPKWGWNRSRARPVALWPKARPPESQDKREINRIS